MDQLGDAETAGIIADGRGQLAPFAAHGEEPLQVDAAVRHGNQDIQHVHEDEGVRDVIAAQGNIQVDVPLLFDDGLLHRHHAVDPLFVVHRMIGRDQADAGALVDRQKLQLGILRHVKAILSYFVFVEINKKRINILQWLLVLCYNNTVYSE